MKRALLLACCLGLLCGLVPGASFGWPDGEHIFLVDLDGELRDLTPDSPSSRDPVYSPRGTQIAYVGTAVDGDLEFPEVFVMNADGANSPRGRVTASCSRSTPARSRSTWSTPTAAD
jgi:Tol biopolymer transport system component